MPKKNKERPEWAVTKGRVSRWEKEQRGQRIILISVSAVIVLVLGLVGYAFYDHAQNQDKEDNQKVLKVNDRSFDLGDYVQFLRYSGISQYASTSYESSYAQYVFQGMQNQEMIRQLALPLGLKVTEAEIDAKIEEQFAPSESSENTSEQTPTATATPTPTASYDTLLKQLKSYGISEKFYRGQVSASILGEKIRNYIGEKDVAKEMAQAHIQGILIDVKAADAATNPESTNTEGGQVTVQPVSAGNEDPEKIRETIKAKLDSGEDFATLAEEFSTDTASRVSGGDLGWLANEIVSLSYSEAFKEKALGLDLGALSEPIPAATSADNTKYWIIQVLAREDSRLVEKDQRDQLIEEAYNKWFEEQSKTLTVTDLLTSELRTLAIQKAMQ